MTSSSVLLDKPLQIPLKIWERITPELPLAPKSIPLDNGLEISPILVDSIDAIVLTPFSMVRHIFVPVSPSGTGKTLRLSTSSKLRRKFLAPLVTKALNCSPFNVLSIICLSPFLFLIS